MPQQRGEPQKIGLLTSTSLVAGNMIASGIFLMPATLAAFGSISLLGWVFSSIGGILLAKVFAGLSKQMPMSDGGPYAYTRAGFGDFMGFLMAWGYWISVWVSNAAIAISLVGALSAFFPALAPPKDPALASQYNPLPAVLTGLGAVWALTWVNTRGIRVSGRVQLVTTILKLTPLVFVAIAGLFFIHPANFVPFNSSGQSNFGAVTATGAITLFAFLGVECATIPAGNVANPEKNIPRATMLGTLISTAVYILVTFCVMGMIPSAQLQHSVTPLADAANIIAGSNARYLVSAGVVVAAFGALNGWILVQGQMPYAVAKDKLFPPIFKKENSKGTPAIGIVITSVLVSALMMMNYSKGLVEQYQFLILLSTLTSVVPYLFCAAAYAVISNRNLGAFTPAKRAQMFTVSALSFLFSLWAIAGAGQQIVYWGFLLLLAGVPFYVWLVIKKPQ